MRTKPPPRATVIFLILLSAVSAYCYYTMLPQVITVRHLMLQDACLLSACFIGLLIYHLIKRL